MKENKKQLNDLTRTFYDESEAAQMSREIEDADALLASFDSPCLRAGLADQIQADMRRRSAAIHRKTVLLRSLLSGAAACLLIGAGLFWMLRQQAAPVLTAGADLNVQEIFSDETAASIASDLDEISEQIYAADVAGWDRLWDTELRTIQEIEEMELLTDNDFWKG